MLDFVVTHWADLLFALTSAVTAASVIVKLTPTPKDDQVVSWVRKAVEWLSLK